MRLPLAPTICLLAFLVVPAIGCADRCASDANCAVGEVCEATFCVLVQPPSRCAVDADCGPSGMCRATVCSSN
jgi:hypothetical protein